MGIDLKVVDDNNLRFCELDPCAHDSELDYSMTDAKITECRVELTKRKI